MDKVAYTEDTINTRPNGVFVQEQIQDLREDVDRLERDREEMLFLLYEIADSQSFEELDDVITKIKGFIETRPFPTPY